MSTTISHTFPREERLRGKADIAALMSHGQWSGEEHVRCCFHTGTGTGINRVMVSVPKKHFRRAVMRNLLKRRMRESYRLQKELIAGSGVDLMLFYGSREVASSEVIRDEIARLLGHIPAEAK